MIRTIAALSMSIAVWASASEGGSITIQSLPKVVRGFPIIIRILAKGPIEVPRTSLFDDRADLTISFVSDKAGGDIFQIDSSHRGIATESNAEGHKKDGVAIFTTNIEAGAEAAMLVDAASLIGSKKQVIDAMPDGTYSVIVTLPSSSTIRSNKIQVELTHPSENEVEFLKLANKLPCIRAGWTQLLIEQGDLSSLPIEKLGEVAKRQLAFHQIILNALQNAKKPAAKQEASEAAVPEYLSLEKNCIDLELQWIAHPKLAEVSLKKFATDHPEFSWLVRNILNRVGMIQIFSGLNDK